jgi:two-component system NtrC family sensor kinase
MRRRGKSDSRPAKGRMPRTVTPKARRKPGVSVLTEQPLEQFDRLKRERDEALEQQRATAEILRLIRASPANLQPIFETIVRNAVSLCGSLFANVFRFDGELLHWVASHNVGPSFVHLLKTKFPMQPDPSQVAGRVLFTKSVVQLEDALSDPDYDQRFPRTLGWRRLLGVPMLREGEPLGVIVVGWAEAGPVPKSQEELLKTFSDQAVIAIENTRLLNELRESLERQTATSEVLKVISGSPGELEPVFQSMLENATRLCEAKFGTMYFREGDAFRAVAMHGAPPDYAEERLHALIRPGPHSGLGRLVQAKIYVQIEDIAAEPEPDSMRVSAVKLGGVRTLLCVPLLKEDEVVGAITIYRQQVRPFTDKQIALVMNFAAQAIIAIENTRLLNELRQRTDDLSEALEQQTAMSKVLGVISRSPTNVHPVFQAIVESAARLCQAYDVVIWQPDGDQLRPIAHCGPIDVAPILLRETPGGKSFLDRKILHIPDVQAEFDTFPKAQECPKLGAACASLRPIDTRRYRNWGDRTPPQRGGVVHRQAG